MPNVHYQPVSCNKFTLSQSLSVAYQFCSTLEPTYELLKYSLTQESHTITFITLLLNTKFLGKPSKDDIRRIFFWMKNCFRQLSKIYEAVRAH